MMLCHLEAANFIICDGLLALMNNNSFIASSLWPAKMAKGPIIHTPSITCNHKYRQMLCSISYDFPINRNMITSTSRGRVTRSECSECGVPTSLASFSTTCPKNCGRGESLGTTTCPKTGVGGKQGQNTITP